MRRGEGEKHSLCIEQARTRNLSITCTKRPVDARYFRSSRLICLSADRILQQSEYLVLVLIVRNLAYHVVVIKISEETQVKDRDYCQHDQVSLNYFQ
jgi:hypothetical protein